MKQLMLVASLLIFFPGVGQVPDSLTLEQCHEMAINRYPLYAQYALLDSREDMQIKSLNTSYLPQLQVNGQASYQSDVTKVDVVIPDIVLPPPIDKTIIPGQPETPDLSKDQYKISLDLQQMIYDGGITARQKTLETINTKIEKQKVTVDLYSLKSRVNEVFFSIILLQENQKLLEVLRDQLSIKIREVESAVNHGVVLPTEKDVLMAERLKVEQQITEVEENRKASFRILSELTVNDIPENTLLVEPQPSLENVEMPCLRPELALFDLQMTKIDASKKLITAQWTPRLVGFGQVGYGRPALNFLNNNFDDFYIFGARLSWELWNWNKNKKDKQVLDLQHQILNTQKEVFNKNVNIAAEHDMAGIRKYEALLAKDMQIIELRERVASTASSQLDNGVITSTEYIHRVNEATQAKINMQAHKVQLIQAKINYLATLGRL